MERLTKTYSDGTHGASDNLPCGENSYTYKDLLLEALGKYEDAEEQGLLLRLPCKVGDILYTISNNGKVIWIAATNKYLIKDNKVCCGCTYGQNTIYVSSNDIGKNVFLTQAEAEQKLKEMESK